MTATKISYRANAPRRDEEYQHRHCSIEIELPEGMTPNDGFFLAEAIVDARLGHRVRNRKKARELYEQVYGEDADFDELEPE